MLKSSNKHSTVSFIGVAKPGVKVTVEMFLKCQTMLYSNQMSILPELVSIVKHFLNIMWSSVIRINNNCIQKKG